MINDVQSHIRTVTCDGPDCNKTATFEFKDETAPERHPFLRTMRVIQIMDGRVFTVCSDVCDVNHIATGARNLQEPKKVIEIPTGNGVAAIQAAAQTAVKAQEATKAIKAGQPVTLD